MLLVYSHKITPRVRYTFKQICTRILGIPVSFTTKVEEFIAHESLKMSYATQPLGNEFHVRSHQVLFEQGLSDLDINIQDWEDTKCFFTTGEKSYLPFDIFAATFYLLSRYEEYLPHVKDEYGRFLAIESLAYKNGFLHQPVVDIWAYKFRDALKERFPKYDFPKREYSIQPIIDVPEAYHYKQKGIMRNIGGTLKDLLGFKFVKLYERFLVLFGFRKDPFDTYNYIINKQRNSRFKFLFFFLIGDYSTYDKGININKKSFQSLIKSVADYCKVGLKASYFSIDNAKLLKKEKDIMESVINTNLTAARFSYNKVDLPKTYRNLLELEINEEYSMGYHDEIGFRAGTCTPFLFYDLDYEIQTPLKLCPFQVMDFALLKTASLLDKEQKLSRLMDAIKQVDGTFTFVFHNYTFSSRMRWKGFKKLFNLILDSVDEVD